MGGGYRAGYRFLFFGTQGEQLNPAPTPASCHAEGRSRYGAGIQEHTLLAPGPPPVSLGPDLAVPVDVHRVAATVVFDVASKTAEVTAEVELFTGGPEGFPVFDLRQDVDGAGLSTAAFDGGRLPADAMSAIDMGAGWDARMRAVRVKCLPATRHLLELQYRLGPPEATGAVAIDWVEGGVRWDLFMSDLEPGRYLEMWLPANLCHDAFTLELGVEVVGAARPHVVLANGTVDERRPGASWFVRYPPNFVSLSPLFVLVPADEVERAEANVGLGGQPRRARVAAIRGAAAGDGLRELAADAVAWLSYLTQRYGAWSHGEDFLAVVWDLPRGMEYDGATTTSEAALEHEVFHSWFGRGVKPARAADGWIDEAMTTWATASRRAPGGRFAVEPLGLDEEPTLLCPAQPWSRHTPREAYGAGARLLAGVAAMAGGAASLRAALAGWHRAHAGRGAGTEQLARYLGEWCGHDLGPWWDRYVYGRGDGPTDEGTGLRTRGRAYGRGGGAGLRPIEGK